MGVPGDRARGDTFPRLGGSWGGLEEIVEYAHYCCLKLALGDLLRQASYPDIMSPPPVVQIFHPAVQVPDCIRLDFQPLGVLLGGLVYRSDAILCRMEPGRHPPYFRLHVRHCFHERAFDVRRHIVEVGAADWLHVSV